MVSSPERAFFRKLELLQADLDATRIPNRVITIQDNGHVLDPSILEKGKWYLGPIAQQINTCYDMSCFDACLVLMRRLVETLIIEAYVAKNRTIEIQDSNGDFVALSDLIANITSQNWGMSRKCKRLLPTFKNLGDFSAHSRMFVARRGDIENIRLEYRALIEELYHLSS